MLTEHERKSALTLLCLLSEEDVVSLAQTTTKGQIETPSKMGRYIILKSWTEHYSIRMVT